MQGLRAIFQMLLSHTVLHIPSFPTSEARRARLTRAVMLTRSVSCHQGQAHPSFPGKTSQVTIPQHEEHQPSSTAEPHSSTSPPYQWLLQFSCCRLCIHKSNLWNAPIREQCNKIHLYYWNINYVCKETVFFPRAPQPPPPSVCRTEHRTGQR